jgi:hypothetical protein
MLTKDDVLFCLAAPCEEFCDKSIRDADDPKCRACPIGKVASQAVLAIALSAKLDAIRIAIKEGCFPMDHQTVSKVKEILEE